VRPSAADSDFQQVPLLSPTLLFLERPEGRKGRLPAAQGSLHVNIENRPLLKTDRTDKKKGEKEKNAY
jgi:hypothetical protein